MQSDRVIALVKSQFDELPGFFNTDWRVGPRYYPKAWTIGMMPSLAEIDDMAAYGMLRYPFFRMYTAGKTVSPSQYLASRYAGGDYHPGYVDYEAAMDLFREGYSFELGAPHLWHKPMALLSNAVGNILHAEVDAQIFVTPPGAQGIVVHRDPGDGIAVQLAGRKRWTLYSRSQDPHWRPGFAPDPGEPILDIVLEPGDVLYFPTGIAHRVRSVDSETSSHMTFGIHYTDAEAMINKIVEVAIDSMPTIEGIPTKQDLQNVVEQLSSSLVDSARRPREEIVASATEHLEAKNVLPTAGQLL